MIINNKSLGVIILAYNVQNFIKNVIETLPDFVDNIYVVDDGSQDNTVKIVKSLNHRNITLIQHDTNKGPGAALASGFKAALINKNDIVVKVDGDGQMSPDQIIHLIKPISEGFADYTKGDRLSKLDYRNSMPIIRLYGNLILTYMTRIASGYWQLNDAQNGFIAISKKALQTIDLRMCSYYGYLNNILIQLNYYNLKIHDVPMPAIYGQEKSAIRFHKYIPKMLIVLIRGLCWRLWNKIILRNTVAR